MLCISFTILDQFFASPGPWYQNYKQYTVLVTERTLSPAAYSFGKQCTKLFRTQG